MECPAYPHPDRNIPLDWMDASDSQRWVYSDITLEHDSQLSNHPKMVIFAQFDDQHKLLSEE